VKEGVDLAPSTGLNQRIKSILSGASRHVGCPLFYQTRASMQHEDARQGGKKFMKLRETIFRKCAKKSLYISLRSGRETADKRKRNC